MNILFSCVGRRSYNVKFFRNHLGPQDRIIATSNTPFTPAFNACDLGILMPDIASAHYIPTVIQLCREQEITGLLSFYDPDVDRLAPHLDELRAIGVVPILPSPEVSAICFDKYRTFLYLKENGWEAPETCIDLEQAVIALNASHLTYPLVIKPRRGFGSQHLFYARNGRERDVFFHYAPDMLIQEKLQGLEYHLDICTGREGQVLSVVPKRKITMRDGETDQAETSDDPALIDIGVGIGKQLGKLGLVGPLDVDLFVQDKRIVILELNPRFGGGYPLSHRAGADFPRLILKMIRGEPVAPEVGRFTPGLLMMKDYDILTRPTTDLCASLLDMR